MLNSKVEINIYNLTTAVYVVTVVLVIQSMCHVSMSDKGASRCAATYVRDEK